jgi:hypothetical protein
MIVQNFQKSHNEQVMQISIHQTGWNLHFLTQARRVSVPEKLALLLENVPLGTQLPM